MHRPPAVLALAPTDPTSANGVAADAVTLMLQLGASVPENDLLRKLVEDTAASLGRAAMRSLSDLVYKVLLANAGSFFGVSMMPTIGMMIRKNAK